MTDSTLPLPEWVPGYFYDLFSCDATMGLNPWEWDDDDGPNFRSRIEGNVYILTFVDSDDEFVDEDGEPLPNAPIFELTVRRIR